MTRNDTFRAVRHALIVSDHAEAERHLAPLIAKPAALSPTQHAQALALSSLLEVARSNFDAAARAIDLAEPLIADPSVEDPFVIALVLLGLADRYWHASDDDGAFECLNYALDGLAPELPAERTEEALFVVIVATSCVTHIDGPERGVCLGEIGLRALDALSPVDARDPLLPIYRANLLMRVGHAELTMGRWAEAERRYRAALRLRRTHLGPDHVQTANAMQALGALLLNHVNAPDIDTASRLLERSHAILESALGPQSPIVVSSSLGLAACELKQGRLASALSHLRLESPSQATAAPDANNAPLKLYLAASLRESGAPLAALSIIAPLVQGLIQITETQALLLKKALTIQLQVLRDLQREDEIIVLADSVTARFGGNQENGLGLVAIATNFQAEVYSARGDLVRAERLIRYAISMGEVGLEGPHEVAPLYRNLKDILELTGRRAEAQAVFKMITKIKKLPSKQA